MNSQTRVRLVEFSASADEVFILASLLGCALEDAQFIDSTGGPNGWFARFGTQVKRRMDHVLAQAAQDGWLPPVVGL